MESEDEIEIAPGSADLALVEGQERRRQRRIGLFRRRGERGRGGMGDSDELRAELEELRWMLAAAEARFQSTVDRSLDGVIVLDRSARVRFANPVAERLFGKSGSDLIGAEFGFPTAAGETTEVDILQAGRAPIVAELRIVETTWDGEPAQLVLLRDVTERKAAEERERALIREQAARAAAEAQARRSAILDHAGRRLATSLDVDDLLRGLAEVVVEEMADVCIIDVDDQNGPLRRLAAARRGFPRTAVIRSLEDRSVRLGLTTPEARVFRTGQSELFHDVAPEWLRAAEEEGDPAAAFARLEPCSLMMVTLYAGALRWGVVTILSCHPGARYEAADLSLAEELIRRAGISIENARLFRLAQEASRAKSDFLAIISHELRTPLSAVVGYTGLLEEGIGGELQGVQREYVGAVRRSAEHLMRLIDQVITFASLEGDHERLELEWFDLTRVVLDVATLTRPMADRKGLRLEVYAPEGGLDLQTDEKKVAQILVNLVTNAIKYTDEGHVRVDAAIEEGEVVLRVSDSGHGIPEDKHVEIFEPFRQLAQPSTRREGGTGIGLSVVKNLTLLLGGEVGVESRPGAGSVFTVRLPRQHTPPKATSRPAEPSSA